VSAATTRAPGSLGGLFKALDAGGVRWCLLRPRESLAQPQGDVDVLVDPDGLERTRDTLTERGFVTVPLPGPDLHAALYDEEAGRFVWMHVQPELRLAGATIPAEAVLGGAAADRSREPGPGWLLWILLLRALVEKGQLSGRHRRRVAALAAEWDGGPPELEELARRHGIDTEAVAAAAAAKDWEALMAHSVHRPAPPLSARARLARLPRRLWGLRRLRERRGLSVAVLGPDGAGKTTLIEGLDRSLPLPTTIQYMGLTGGRLPRADRLRVPGLVLAARIAILWLRYLRAEARRARGEIVLFDRYTLDGSVPSGMRLTLAGRISRRIQRRVCPMPDLVLLLDASGATMHGRKGEYEPEVLETWRAAYSRLRETVPVLRVIDAEQPAEAVRREAEALVWRRYRDLRATRSGKR